MSHQGNEFGFASPELAPIPYLERIRTYYEALGYGAPYQWAHYVDVPFHPLRKPLAQSHVAIITTAAPYQPDKGDQGPRAPYNAAAKFYTVSRGFVYVAAVMDWFSRKVLASRQRRAFSVTRLSITMDRMFCIEARGGAGPSWQVRDLQYRSERLS